MTKPVVGFFARVEELVAWLENHDFQAPDGEDRHDEIIAEISGSVLIMESTLRLFKTDTMPFVVRDLERAYNSYMEKQHGMTDKKISGNIEKTRLMEALRNANKVLQMYFCGSR